MSVDARNVNIVFGRNAYEKQERARQMRAEQTPTERRLWQSLRANRLADLHFRRQQVIEGFIVDFYCHVARLVVEVDGGVHTQQAEYDMERDTILAAQDLRVLRFTHAQICNELPAVLRAIANAAGVSSYTPPVSGGDGGGFV